MSRPTTVASLIAASQAHERSGDIGPAHRHAREAVHRARSTGEPESIASALAWLGLVEFRLGHYEQVRTLAREALSLTDAETPTRAEALLLLGMAATETDDLATGEQLYQQVIDLSRATGNARALVRALHNLAAGVYLPQGRFQLALAADAEALVRCSEYRLPELAVYSLVTSAWVCWIIGERQHAQNSLADLARTAAPTSLATGYLYCVHANLALDDGDVDEAVQLYAQARTIAETIGEPGLNIQIRLGMSRASKSRGDTASAAAWAAEAVSTAAAVRYRHLEGEALTELARCSWLGGDLEAAERHLRQAIQSLAPLGAAYDLARARLVLAALLHQQRRPEAATAWVLAASAVAGGGYGFLLERERSLAIPLLAAHLGASEPAARSLLVQLLNQLQKALPPPLHVTMLGRFQVRRGRQLIDPPALRWRRAGELLALLLLSPGRCLTADQVTDALWPEKEPLAARTPFHHATSALRRALEPDLPDRFPSRYLAVEGGQVTLTLPPGSTVDAETFEAHWRRGEWEPALGLCRGELLPDLRYAGWAVTARERISLLHQRALLSAAEARLAAGVPHRALELIEQLLALEPWHEQAVLVGMQASVALNDRPRALRHYRALEKELRQELDTAPAAELQTLYRKLIGL